MENEAKTTFDRLYAINVNDYTETKKNGNTELTYLSWVWAWARFKKECPAAQYYIKHYDGKPYIYDEDLGYMVETTMTNGEEEHSMWLPVMDGANKAMKNKPYKYQVKKYGEDKKWHGEYEDKEVKAATMFDINTAIMRCLVKNIGMFGLGLYIYAGEDIPEGETVREGVKARNTKATVEEVIAGMDKMTLANCKAFYARAIGLYGKGTPEYTQWIKVWADKKDALEANKVAEELDDVSQFLNGEE